MSKRPATATRGRGRGRGRGAGGRGASTAVKRTKKNVERDCLLLLIDSASNSSLTELNGKTSFVNSVNIADWILSRKIFAESDSFVNVAHFPTSDDGNHVYGNVICQTDMFIKPTIDQLKWIHNIKQSKNNGDFIAALRGSLEYIKQASSDSDVDKITITLMSNLSGEVENVSKHELKELCDSLNENNIDVLFVGDNTAVKSDIPQTTLDALEYVKEHCATETLLFENALNKVKFFSQKPTAIRGQIFSLELSNELKIDLQLYVKISEEKLKLKLLKVTDGNEEVSTIREFEEVKVSEVKEEIDEDDLEPAAGDHGHEEEGNRQTLTKGDLIKGYHYGSTIVPFSEGDKKLAAVERTGKCLQLIQFTNKANILPHFLFGECRYFLPHVKSDTASTALASLVQAMINLDTVALVRYAYNIASNPRVAVLIPKFSKTGCPVLQHFVLPFNEDIRGFEFPALESLGEEPNDFQLDTVDAFIDELMLIDKVKDESGKTQRIEKCRIKDIRNPRNQAVLMSLKRKALGMPAELSEDETKALFEMMSAPPETLERSQKVMNSLKKSFELHKKTESAGIDGKSLNEINGGGKVEKWEDMEV